MNVKQFVKGNSEVTFEYFRQGNFYYKVENQDTGVCYEFPVPLDDIGTATMLHTDKALVFMRWIRKSIDEKTIQLHN